MENSNRDVRTELSELIGRLLSNIHEARKPDASLASSELTSATEAIADAILDEFQSSADFSVIGR